MITASLIGAQTPPLVQIVISETPPSEQWELLGTDGAYSWIVPGGGGLGDGGQLTLADNRGPGNRPLTYIFVTADGNQASEPVTIPFTNSLAIQSLDGQRSINVEIAGMELTASYASRQEVFDVPGRRRPAVRYAAGGDAVGKLSFWYPVERSDEVRALFASGEPLIYRSGGNTDDLEPVGVFAYSSPESVAVTNLGLRQWSFTYTLLDDPYADRRLGAFTWDFIDGLQVQSGAIVRDGDDMEQLLAGLTWDEIDRLDWSVYA